MKQLRDQLENDETRENYRSGLDDWERQYRRVLYAMRELNRESRYFARLLRKKNATR